MIVTDFQAAVLGLLAQLLGGSVALNVRAAAPLTLDARIFAAPNAAPLWPSSTNFAQGTVFEANASNSADIILMGPGGGRLTLRPGDKASLPLSDWSTLSIVSETTEQALFAFGFG